MPQDFSVLSSYRLPEDAQDLHNDSSEYRFRIYLRRHAKSHVQDHSNSNKKFKEQIRIVSEVIHSRNYNPELKTLVKGVMIESYLEEGNQSIDSERVYGRSITDPCLGWIDTERLIYEIAEKC